MEVFAESDTLPVQGVSNVQAEVNSAQKPHFLQNVASIAPLVVVFVLMYFITIRPANKKKKEHDALINSLKIGDSVILHCGIYGIVRKLRDNSQIDLEIAHDVTISVLKNAVANVLSDKEYKVIEKKGNKLKKGKAEISTINYEVQNEESPDSKEDTSKS